MVKIDSEELLDRVNKLDPCFYDSAVIKWEIIQIIKDMVEVEDGKID